jgi:drug/metabolite transporter (DMT)-like permease
VVTVSDPSGRSRRVRLLLAFATIYVVWGSTYLAVARAIETIPPLLMMSIRLVAAGGLLYLWTWSRGVTHPRPTEWRAALRVSVVLIVGTYGFMGWAMERIPTGVAALLAATSPMWAVGIARVWPGERRPVAGNVLGAVVGLGGVALLLGQGAPGGVDLAGAAAMLGSGICWSLGAFLSRGAALPRSLPQATGMQMMTGGALLFLVSTFAGELGAFSLGAATPISYVALAYLITFGSLLAFYAYTYALRETSPMTVMTHTYVNPLVAVMLGWALAGEQVTSSMLVAGGIIVLAVALITRRGKREPATA